MREKVVAVALSIPEQRRLAETDTWLNAEDPALARMMADWSVTPSGHAPWTIATGVMVSAAALVTGAVLVGARPGNMLVGIGIVGIVLGMLGLLITLTIGAPRLWPSQNSSVEPESDDAGRMVPRPGTEQWYLWLPWSWWG